MLLQDVKLNISTWFLLGGVRLFWMETGTLFYRLHYSQAAPPPKQPPRLNVNRGGRLNMTVTVNNPLTEAVIVEQLPPLND